MTLSPNRTSTRTRGSEGFNRLADRPPTRTEMTHVLIVLDPSFISHTTSALGAEATAAFVGTRDKTGIAISCGDIPPWKYALAPPALNAPRPQGTAASRSSLRPIQESGTRRKYGSDEPPIPTHTRRWRSFVCPPGGSILVSVSSSSAKT